MLGFVAMIFRTPAPTLEDVDRLSLERLIFFSDAVFAIAITLLALDIRLPNGTDLSSSGALRDALFDIWPRYLGYVLSFLVIGTMWTGHHSKWRWITSYDRRLIFLNLITLMVIAFVPFPTSVLSQHANATSTIFYASTIVAVGVLTTITWAYAERGNRFVSPDLAAVHREQGYINPLGAPFVFLLSIPVALVNDELARWSWLLIIPATGIAPRLASLLGLIERR